MNERDLSDEALGRRLAAELPRHHAPAALRAAIVRSLPAERRRPVWLAPALAALATAMLLLLVFVPLLPTRSPDPVHRLVRSVAREHTRTAILGPRAADAIPAALPRLAQQSGITLARVFSGDEKLTLVSAEPVYLEQRRGLALHYRDDEGRLLTYVVLPASGFPVPERGRVQIDRFKPALVRDEGFSAWVWKQGELACVLVSKMDAEQDLGSLKDYFLRVRGATEPVLTN